MAKPLPPTEVEAYGHIRQQLGVLGWVVKNPSLNTGGEVWTQNQCLSHPIIKQALGADRPENIVKITERYLWVIEAKASRQNIDKAVREAIDDYSKPINDLQSDVEVFLATGLAGDDAEGYSVRHHVRLDGAWHPITINGQEPTGLLAPSDVQFLLEHQVTDTHEFAPPQWIFLQAAII